MLKRARSQFDEVAAGRVRELTRVRCDDPSLTQQSFAEDADLNVLVKRFGIDKEALPPAVFDPDYYGDVGDVPDLRTALEIVRDAQARFDALPAKLRRRFENDPAKLWEFVHDPENADEAVRLGVLFRPERPQEARSPGEPTGGKAPEGSGVGAPPGASAPPDGGAE